MEQLAGVLDPVGAPMSGVSDDLATLNEYLRVGVPLGADHMFSVRSRAIPALARVEAEVARLTEGLQRIATEGSAAWDKPPWSPREIARAVLAGREEPYERSINDDYEDAE